MFSSSLSELMNSTEVDESLSTTSTDVLFQRIPTNFKISLVASVGVIVSEDDEPNKVEFVLIYIHGEFTETLHWYCMTKNTLPCFSYHIYLWHVFIYIHIC